MTSTFEIQRETASPHGYFKGGRRPNAFPPPPPDTITRLLYPLYLSNVN